MKTEMYKSEDLERTLGDMGMPVAFFQSQISPSSIIYHFNLKNPLDYLKLKRIVPCLSAQLHKPVKAEKSDKASFCLSIPRNEREYPLFKDFHTALKGKPAGEILFGIDSNGTAITRNIRDTKSLLIGGSSGGGKSVCLSNIICSLLAYSKPSECGLLLIDLKRCEFELFKNADHLVMPVQFDYNGAYNALRSVLNEIQNRYKSMQEQGIRKATIDKYPLLITVIDEYAELARGNKNELDEIVAAIASTGRACNVFIIIATQHAVSTIISNTIKSNLQSRIGLRTTNIAQSACIIGTRDCADLLGYGDSYVSFDGVAGLQRIQVCNIIENDINEMLKEQNNKTPRQTAKTGHSRRFRTWLDKFFGGGGKTRLKKEKRQPELIADSTATLNFCDTCID